MAFLRPFFASITLVTITLIMQSTGMASLIIWARAHFAGAVQRFGSIRTALLVVRFNSMLVCLHMSEIILWACFFRWKCFPTWESAFYFSASSYSTVGYGDVIAPLAWRTLGPVESITGVLMCGVSVSVLFAVVARLVQRDEERDLEKIFKRTASQLVDTEAAREAAQRAASPPAAEQNNLS